MMNLYRRLHIFDPNDMGALCSCAREAASIIEISSVLRKRKVLRYCANWVVFLTASSGIMTMYTLGRRVRLRLHPAIVMRS